MQYDIFISYRRSDQPVARALVAELEKRGVKVWWDQIIEGGEDWRDAIVQGLQSSTCLVILFSEECNDSKQLKKELAIADTLNKLVIPVLIEDTQPRGHYLYELAALNWIQVFPNPHSRAGDLAERLARELGLEQQPAPVPAPAPEMAAPVAESLEVAPSGEFAATAPAPVMEPGIAAPTIQAPGPAPTPAPIMQPVPAPQPAEAVPAARREATAEIADAVRAKAERKRLRESRRKTMRDFMPLHWVDLIPLGLLGTLFYYILTEEWYVYLMLEYAGVALMAAAFALAVFGSVVFPVRYYMRRRRVWRTALMQALNSLVMVALFVVGLIVWWEGDTSTAIDESLYFIPPIFFTLLIVTVVIYGILNGQRAVRSFRKNVEVL